jgi:hypothetical protein
VQDGVELCKQPGVEVEIVADPLGVLFWNLEIGSGAIYIRP